MVKRKRPVQLTAQEKVALIRQYETSDASMHQLAEQYGVTHCTVSTIIRAKERWMLNPNKRTVTNTTAKHADLEAQLLADFLEANTAQNIKNTNVWLTERALAIAKSLNIKKFKASNFWLYQFKLRHNLKVQQYRVERAATAAAPSAFAASSSTDRILPNVELGFHSSSLDDDVKYLGNLDPDEHLLLSHNQPSSSSSDELIDSSLNVAADVADDTNYPDDDTNNSNSSFDQQMNAELFPSRFPAVTTSEQQQQRMQPANLVTAAPARAVPVNKEKPPKGPPKGSREEAIEAATTLIRYVTINTTDFDASSSSFLAKLTGYLNQLINSQPSTEGN